MRATLPFVAALIASLALADVSVAQPPPPYAAGRPQAPYGGPGAYRGAPQQYYYNGRWVGPEEWRRHDRERERWARNYRRHGHEQDSTAALLGGIIGFALGAAIVGSAQQAEQARTADARWDAYCAGKYRSYDRASRTYLGSDGLRHYCQ